MCGIVGFTGRHQAAPILLDGLSKLEYRGYDSAGLAVRDGENETEVIKAKGRLKVLMEKTNGGESVPGTCGIGHTRWATHGEPSEMNAHPHVSDDGNVVAVHNGIIENYQELKDMGVNVVSVSLDNDRDKWLKALNEDQVSWLQLVDLDGFEKSKVRKDYKVERVPTVYLIDPQGKVLITGPSLEEVRDVMK